MRAVAAALCLAVPACSPGDGGQEQPERSFDANVCAGPTLIDDTGFAGRHNDIAVDEAGVHVVYDDADHQAWRYATNVSGSWVHENVVPMNEAGEYVSLALDGAGSVHVAYLVRRTGDLYYASNAGGFWQGEAVDQTGDVGEHSSIDVTEDGVAHIAYYDYGNRNLKYASNGSGAWLTETVDDGDDVGQWAALALDGSGKVHISYQDKHDEILKYATNESGAWVVTDIDDDPAVGEATAIAVSPDGAIRIATTKGRIKLVDPTTGDITTIPGSVAVDEVGIALRGEASIHVAFTGFQDELSGNLRYARNSDGASAADFGTATLEIDGGWPSLALGPDGTVHISYWNDATQALGYVGICP